MIFIIIIAAFNLFMLTAPRRFCNLNVSSLVGSELCSRIIRMDESEKNEPRSSDTAQSSQQTEMLHVGQTEDKTQMMNAPMALEK